MKPVAIVIPWFGEALKGGAEQQAWQLATRLAARGHQVEVLTTCCRSFFDDWSENHHPEGMQTESGLCVRRFKVDRRDKPAFDTLNQRLLAIDAASLRPGCALPGIDDADLWQRENINSAALQAWLQRAAAQYAAFIFMPYLYGTTLNGLPLVASRAWLQPCLHDEAYAYLPGVARAFYGARRLLFNSAGEMQLAARLYGPMVHAKGHVMGEGVELNDSDDGADEVAPYLLSLGRRCPEKGTDSLVAHFRAYRRRHPASPLRLVLAGPGDSDYGDADNGIVDLALVSDQHKWRLLRGCLALAQPSPNESFSRVLFEAWGCGKPALVNARCLATAVAVEQCGGGWVLDGEAKWTACFANVEQTDYRQLAAIGARGQQYAAQMADWDNVMARYDALLKGPGQGRVRDAVCKGHAVHQILPNLTYGDAISNQAMQLQDWLKAMGAEANIYVGDYIDPRVADRGLAQADHRIDPAAALIYHHSIGSPVTRVAIEHPGPKCLIYHNITPAEFYRSYDADFARLLRQGREEMWTLARQFAVAAGVSRYNAAELEGFGFHEVSIAPLGIDPAKWDEPPDPDVMAAMQDGRDNLLFVGRYVPHKRQDQLIELLAWYRAIAPMSRLVLVGHGNPDDPYVRSLSEHIERLGQHNDVRLTGPVSDAELQAYYRTATAFVSFSEHEGFGVPLIEAMWFDVPVIAYRSSAIAETLAGAGLLLDDKRNLEEVALLLRRLLNDADLHRQVIEGQRERRVRNLPGAVQAQYEQLLVKLGVGQT